MAGGRLHHANAKGLLTPKRRVKILGKKRRVGPAGKGWVWETLVVSVHHLERVMDGVEESGFETGYIRTT